MNAVNVSPERLNQFLNTFSDLMEQMRGNTRSDHSIQTVTNEMLITKARAGKSPAYLKTLRAEIACAFKGHLREAICGITVSDLEEWFFRTELKPRTQRNLAQSARTLFAFAERRGYVRSNPAAALEPPPLENTPVEILSPGQVAAVMRTARKFDVDVCRLLAVQFFAGLRTSEAMRLAEAEIGERYIEVKAEKCKTRRRRLVTVTPTLRAWLNVGGRLPVTQVWTRLAALKHRLRAEGIPFPRNAARHSFCSYHLAHFGNAAQTALQAGHSEAMLFAHYRELVTPEAAAEFWAIVPAPSSNARVGVE